jgi:S-DNA-T family DNA segregation ATPase FtsK/SpoIIIE
MTQTRTLPGRSWRLDLAAGILLLAGFLVAVSLFSYHPSDPPTRRILPANTEPQNLLGRPGAQVAHELIESLGVAVYALLACWFVVVLLLLLRRDWLAWSLRLTGWLLLIPITAAVADQFGGTGPSTPLAGPGGTIGAWATLTLERHFDLWGQRVVLGLALFLGVVLSLDVILMQLVKCCWRISGRGVILLGKLRRAPREAASAAKPSRRRGTAQLPAGDDEERDIPIRHHDTAALPTPALPALPPASAPEEKAKPAIPPKPAEPLPVNRHQGDRAAAANYADFELPSLDLLEDPLPFPHEKHDAQLRETAALLEKTFADFSLNVKVVGINTGPVITQFEVALETGLRVHKVTRLADDVALNLKVPSVRMVAPIPGKNTVGVEIPNEHRAVVRLKEVMLAADRRAMQCKLPLFLGKDVEGRALVQDLADMPHLLIAGSTGTGKSVCMNTLIVSLLMTRRPDEVKMIMVDPKAVEMREYSDVPHLIHPVVTDKKKAEAILAWAVDKMEERYDILSRARVRNITSYNQLSYDEILRRVKPDEEERQRLPETMPYIVIFIDEMADLILQMRKEIEGHIIRLAQKSRAAGIHLVVATQKPTVDVITGLIKSNLPSRICFKVTNKSDSRVVLDEMGADKLLGKGDMLFLAPGTSALVRGQGTFVSEDEVLRVTGSLDGEPCFEEELMKFASGGGGDLLEKLRERDPVYEQAVEVVIREQRGSVSLLQRVLGIGYGRAARLIDFMAEDGIVGMYNGSSAREVLFNPEQWEEVKAGAAAKA